MYRTSHKATARRAIGDRFETAARAYLEARGLRFVRANFLCRHGEIDLVMRDRDTIVFVEVRYRRSSAFGGAVGSITARKRQRLSSAAHIWMMANPWDARRSCRFDVVAFEGDIGCEVVEWVRGAFEP
ncbi:YraN family protein [Bacillus sp. NP157]|nr:YraN family protein [Bacillus sp. NP157]